MVERWLERMGWRDGAYASSKKGVEYTADPRVGRGGRVNTRSLARIEVRG